MVLACAIQKTRCFNTVSATKSGEKRQNFNLEVCVYASQRRVATVIVLLLKEEDRHLIWPAMIVVVIGA